MPVITLPYNLTFRPYQEPSWKAFVIDGVLRGLKIWPRRNGKDLIDLNILTAKSMQRVGQYLYVAPFYGQIRNIIWEGADDNGRRFIDYIPPELIKRKRDDRMMIELKNNSIIKLAGSDNPDSLVGGNPVGIVFTEFSLHKPEGWDYLRPILANNGGWALFNGTPRGLNHFYTMAEMAKKNPSWFFQHLTRDDTGYPSLEAIEEDRLSGMPESLIQQEYYTSFLSSTEATLIPLEIIQPCLTTRLEPKDYNFEPRLIGVDPAYSAKGDKAIIVKRQGRFVHPLRKFRGISPDDLANKIVEDILAWRPHGVLVDSGRGEGVISRLNKMGYEDIVFPVDFGGAAYGSHLYLNKRAEIWCRMRDFFLQGSRSGNYPLLPDDKDLIAGLSTPMMFYNEGRGKIQIESKKEIRSRGAYVMDEPDALAVTFAEDVVGDKVLDTKLGRLRAELDMLDDDYDSDAGYDPLNHFNRQEEAW